MEELFNLEERPDAIIGLSDKLTTGALRFLQKKGIKIPEEIALKGIFKWRFHRIFKPLLKHYQAVGVRDGPDSNRTFVASNRKQKTGKRIYP